MIGAFSSNIKWYKTGIHQTYVHKMIESLQAMHAEDGWW